MKGEIADVMSVAPTEEDAAEMIVELLEGKYNISTDTETWRTLRVDWEDKPDPELITALSVGGWTERYVGKTPNGYFHEFSL